MVVVRCMGLHRAMRFVDHSGKPTETYPHNPNGSPDGLTAVTTADGRFTVLMPHPERVFRNVQMSWTSGERSATITEDIRDFRRCDPRTGAHRLLNLLQLVSGDQSSHGRSASKLRIGPICATKTLISSRRNYCAPTIHIGPASRRSSRISRLSCGATS